MIILDSDVMIDLLRRYQPAVDWLATLGDTEIVLPGFVVMELLQGCRNKDEQQRVQKVLKQFRVVWPSPDVCDEALTVFATYYLSHGIGLMDALIGQTAVGLDQPLYTFNRKHYAAVPNLSTVQPYHR